MSTREELLILLTNLTLRREARIAIGEARLSVVRAAQHQKESRLLIADAQAIHAVSDDLLTEAASRRQGSTAPL